MNDARRPESQKDIALFFLSSGLFVLPLMATFFAFDAQVDRLAQKNESLFFAIVILGALGVAMGMYTVAKRFPRKATGTIGGGCWAITIALAWIWSSSL
jgi:hypothetical protein